MTKRRDLLTKIDKAAKNAGLDWGISRQGSNHTIYSLDGLEVPIGRHAELGNRYAETVYKQLEPKLGKDWWRK
jgi:alpha-L-fucosidase